MKVPHSILLKSEKCVGCTHCVKNCPTKAIRVHNGKAKIKDEYCIDCGECIRSCSYHAKYAKTEQLGNIEDYDYTVALVPRSFYGQFNYDIVPEKILIALKKLGFDLVKNIAEGENVLRQEKDKYIKNQSKTIISSSCQTVVRLIKLLYPELLDQLLPFKTPEEILATKIKSELKEELALEPEKIGVFLITACPAKLTAVNNPLGMEESDIDGAIAVNGIYHQMLDKVKRIKKIDDHTNELEPREKPYLYKKETIDISKSINVTGIKNVISVLEELSRENSPAVKYFNLSACHPAGFGGILNVKNPFVAKFNFNNLFKDRYKDINIIYKKSEVLLPSSFKENVVNPLDNNIMAAMNKLSEMEKVVESLPKLDCAACGAPDCQTLAEDIVNDLANRTDCIFILRQEVADLADEMAGLANEMPPIMQAKKKESGKDDS